MQAALGTMTAQVGAFNQVSRKRDWVLVMRGMLQFRLWLEAEELAGGDEVRQSS